MPIKITTKNVVEEYVRRGLIPFDYRDEFEACLSRELDREVRRLAADAAGYAGQHIRAKMLLAA